MANHRWSEADDKLALYVYLFGVEKLATTVTDLARSHGIKPGSFRMRMKNFQALERKGGLVNWSDQSEKVFNRYRNTSEEELRALVGPEHQG